MKRGITRLVQCSRVAMLCVLGMTTLAACALGTTSTQTSTATGIHKIQHVVVIMQENRSFDSYFGTYPGADGIPMQNGVPTVCVDDPRTGQCVKPYHDPKDINGGGPHDEAAAAADLNSGKMDGFLVEAEKGKKGCVDPTNPNCTNAKIPDVMGYHDARQLPHAWNAGACVWTPPQLCIPFQAYSFSFFVRRIGAN